MKKSLFILLLGSLLLLPLTNSCGPYEDPPEVVKSHWELTSSEFWGVIPSGDETRIQFSQFPFNISYPWNGDVYTYSGQEMSVTRSEWYYLSNSTVSITYTWSQMPDIIYPDTDYTLTYESKGNVGNGIWISKPVYYVDSYVWLPTGGYRDGPKTATIRMTAPDSDPNHQKAKIGVEMASGRSYHMEWRYVYEWVQ